MSRATTRSSGKKMASFQGRNTKPSFVIQANRWELIPMTRLDFGDDTALVDGGLVLPEGTWLVGGIVTLKPTKGGGKVISSVYKNGSLYALLGRGTAVNGELTGFAGSVLMESNGSDKIQLHGFAEHGGQVWGTYSGSLYTHLYAQQIS